MSIPEQSPGDKKHEKLSLAVGQTLATLQHLADLAFDWGFKKMKNVGQSPAFTQEDVGASEQQGIHQVLPTLKKFGLKTLSFLGSVGDSYYDAYEKLKAKRSEKRGEKKEK
ncbi:MAG: hypothetical protein WCG83_05395 [Candidatus Peregrinibacteria bacterium]